MPAAKKATKASQTKTARRAKAAPKAKAKAKVTAKSPVRLVGKPKQATAPPGRKGAVAFKKGTKPMAGEPRNIIMELWKAKEEKRRNETPHAKFHQTGPPSGGYASHPKHDSFARHTGQRRKAS